MPAVRDMRSLDQNKLMWALLTDIANQVRWSVNGSPTMMSPDDWKDVLTAALTKHRRIAEGLDGGFVFLGMRTSKMTKEQMTELIELIQAFGAERGVEWTDEQG